MIASKETERWGVFELVLDGPTEGNPFTDVRLSARFRQGLLEAEAEGFYDGGGIYRIRFMPSSTGAWTYETSSSCPGMDGIAGEFVCTAALPGNRGPVRVKDNVHFQHADGTKFIPVGTACRSWHLQSGERQQRTLDTLRRSPFNRVSMCVLPHRSAFGDCEPEIYPFAGTPERGFDFSRPNPGYFARLEQKVRDLAKMNIEADLVLFHPHDEERWGFDRMSADDDERYVRYVVARLGAYRNVWWTLAEDSGAMPHKTEEMWRRLFLTVEECDCGRHLRSIQGGPAGYDFGAPWVTHVSLRHDDVRAVSDCTRHFGKPAILGDCGCEGNLDAKEYSLTPEDMLFRLWEGHVRGGYATHGETYDGEALWSLHGGRLYGKSAERIRFMRRILEEAPDEAVYGGERLDAAMLEVSGEYYLQYFGPHRFSFREFALPEGSYEVDVIDTWNMTVASLEGKFTGRFRVDLPAKPYYALRIRKVNE
nr:DUF5605 domain-containing protein [Paenibacillus hamazuiensis]